MPISLCWQPNAGSGLDDGSFWPVLEGIPATEMFNVIPLAPGHAYGMFMERFNDLSLLNAQNVFEMEGFLPREMCTARSESERNKC